MAADISIQVLHATSIEPTVWGQHRFSLVCPPACRPITVEPDIAAPSVILNSMYVAVSGVMGDCCSIPKSVPDEVPALPPLNHTEELSAKQNGNVSLHDTQTTDQQSQRHSGALLPEQKPQESTCHWQQEQTSQSKMQQQITLQSQEIAKLREQIIDLQAYRQQQQKQHQRAAYIKSQTLPAARSHKMQIPQDCCAAAMACCIAVQEMKADLKVEGQLICKRLDTLSDLRVYKGHINTVRSSSINPQPSLTSCERSDSLRVSNAN